MPEIVAVDLTFFAEERSESPLVLDDAKAAEARSFHRGARRHRCDHQALIRLQDARDAQVRTNDPAVPDQLRLANLIRVVGHDDQRLTGSERPLQFIDPHPGSGSSVSHRGDSPITRHNPASAVLASASSTELMSDSRAPLSSRPSMAMVLLRRACRLSR